MKTRLVRVAVASLAPLVVGLSMIGGACKKSDPTTTTAPSATSVAVVVSASASTSASASIEPAAVDASIVEDASIDDASFDDATLDGEVGDAKGDAKSDAPDDAPLMGAATFIDESEARGLRKITVAAARVHKAPKDQNILATLPHGTEVTLSAQLGDWYRVRYTDPNLQIRRQGWLYETTFAGPKRKTCPDNWSHHDNDGGWCDRECKTNRDCKAIPGYKCSGTMCFYAGSDTR